MKLRKLGVMLLAMLLALSMLVSCNLGAGSLLGTTESDDGKKDATTTTDDGKEQTPPKEQVENLEFIKSGLSDYRIIYSLNKTAWEYDMALNLQAAIERLTGIKLKVMNDLEFEDEPHTMRQEKEILIGETSRSDEYTVPAAASDINLGYTMFVAYERIVILGHSHMGMYRALRQFILDQFGYDLDDYDKDISKLPEHAEGVKHNVTIHHTYFQKSTVNSDYFANLNVMLGDFVVKHDSTSLYHRVAYQVSDAIYDATGVRVEVTNQAVADGTPIIKLRSDSTLEKGTWKITAEDKTITISANGYYGFYDAATYFKTAIEEKGYYEFEEAATGDYVDHATGQQETTKYAYDKRGDIRVMYLNVLFGTVDPTARNPLQAYMIEEYQPDVLGCQEFNNTKRGYNEEGNGGLVELLAELGYAEAVDPRVRNAYAKDEDIPGTEEWGYLTNSLVSEGQALKGYGGGSTVTVNGETYNTFYNNTPLFYNTNTTELIKAEYYWYKNQWDKRIIDGQMVNHENGAMDCGSKAATWGLFQNKATGDRYIVISTHMCTRSDYIRGLQGQEIVALIEDLIAQYNCPVFFGGDMNGNIGDANYDLFIEEGYLSLQDSLVDGAHVASEFTSNLRTNQSAYPVVDSERYIMTPAKNSTVSTTVQETNKNSIDQIFMINGEDVDVSIFGVIVDDITRSSSDHMPIFTDFSLQ